MNMIKRILIALAIVMMLSSVLHAGDITVVSIDMNFQWAILKETSSGSQVKAKLEESFSGWKVRGITKDYVTVSRIYNGYLLMVPLPVPGSVSSPDSIIVKN